ncbi:hypothetical protein [Uliginosibacterium sp. H1]|uniref:hypothetical protein n=1 Tax=Uliginosibacterium sp. H1 TaxID=3114757 RepID=UPI002E19460D|nr:hypothetical protein [Uliginosibacterium sp. H1]
MSDVYSLSGCVSPQFDDYVNYWRHNGFWLFDSPRIIELLAQEHDVSLDGMKLFYYEAHEEEFDDERNRWVPFGSEEAFGTAIDVPAEKTLEGFDVTGFMQHTTPECSPLSCNSLAESIPTNAHCLLSTFDEAVKALESGAFRNAEPGPYRIIAVYSVKAA